MDGQQTGGEHIAPQHAEDAPEPRGQPGQDVLDLRHGGPHVSGVFRQQRRSQEDEPESHADEDHSPQGERTRRERAQRHPGHGSRSSR